ncbi:hypothetical protein [Thiocapsa sp. UBA6158]|uniref:hypothetical protein n=1 Tax=Thiocapsa sp. UBA6158 TaxID=1947692 RepID=UPI0025FF392B|nr:hypothetical protein [Thiocapsa sp. UBA6158]
MSIKVVGFWGGVAADDPRLAAAGTALQPRDLNPLATYTESGATLEPLDGVLTIPLDGRVLGVALAGDLASVVLVAPAPPVCGSVICYVLQDAAGGHLFPIPAAWYWPDATVTDIAPEPGALTELILNTTPTGLVVARATVLGVPA